MIRRVFCVSVDSESKAVVSEQCGRIAQRCVGQSSQSDGVKGAKTQVQKDDIMVTTLRKRVLTTGDRIVRIGGCFTDIVKR